MHYALCIEQQSPHNHANSNVCHTWLCKKLCDIYSCRSHFLNFVDMRDTQARISYSKTSEASKVSKLSTLNFYFNPRPISIASGLGSAPRNVRYNSIGSSVPPFSSNVRNFCAVSWSKMPFSLNNAYASLSNTSAHK